MIIRYPTYYKQFHCIASKCKNSCCAAGWEIAIDKESADYYKNVSSKFGDLLRKNINFSLKPNRFNLNSDGRCPFFNNNNLCDIYITLGKEHLCEICKEHPRFYEFFIDKAECGICLYCEEAARIILSQTTKFTTYMVKFPSSNEDLYNDGLSAYAINLYKYLYTVRTKIFKYLYKSNISINSKIKDILWYAYTIQQDIDNEMYDKEKIIRITTNSTSDIEPIVNFIANFEPNNPNWPSYLKENCKKYKKNISKISNFESENPQITNYLKNISIYFIYRYLLKSCQDGDLLSKVKLMAVSIAIIKMLYFCKWIDTENITFEDCIEITRKYSEEIECSDDNLSIFADKSYIIKELSTEYIMGLF